MHLLIGNKLYSSWSLRPWLLMTALGVPFQETVIPLHQADTKKTILAHSPSGQVPLLIDGPVRVWESLAIMEYIADKIPGAGVWPTQTAARAHARAASSEMHAGFQALRQNCPMNLGRQFKARVSWAPDVVQNVARLEMLWGEARRDFGQAGPFLYGAFSAADAMFAPVVTRLDSYQIEVTPGTRQYMNAVLQHPAFVAWRNAARQEPWFLPHYEQGHEVETSFIAAKA
jgi:glutathione S-transferase